MYAQLHDIWSPWTTHTTYHWIFSPVPCQTTLCCVDTVISSVFYKWFYNSLQSCLIKEIGNDKHPISHEVKANCHQKLKILYEGWTEKVAELLKALSHNDFRGCFKGLKALHSILEFLMESTVHTLTCNNNFTDKVLFKNQSHYLSATLHIYNPKDRNPSLTTQTHRQTASQLPLAINQALSVACPIFRSSSHPTIMWYINSVTAEQPYITPQEGDTSTQLDRLHHLRFSQQC